MRQTSSGAAPGAQRIAHLSMGPMSGETRQIVAGNSSCSGRITGSSSEAWLAESPPASLFTEDR
eukprot:11188856-Lingulodinium_polyedra.AAC.1